MADVAAVETEDELVEARLEVFWPQAAIDPERPGFEVAKHAVNPGRDDMGRYLADDMGADDMGIVAVRRHFGVSLPAVRPGGRGRCDVGIDEIVPVRLSPTPAISRVRLRQPLGEYRKRFSGVKGRAVVERRQDGKTETRRGVQVMGNVLGENDPPPFIRFNDEGPASVLILCDHASKAIPLRLGNLGISPEQVSTHIAWDIGAQMVAERLAERFDAPALFCGISRLVIDCNRRLGNSMLVPSESDGVVLPGSQSLTQAQIGERIEAIYLPYHYAIVRNLTRFEEKGIRPLVLSVHSYTPVFNGVERPWSIGISHTSDEMISRPIIKVLNQLGAFLVGDNEPYDVDVDIDYTICAHALHVGLSHLQVEFRQDLIEKKEDAQRWADILYDAIQAVWSPLDSQIKCNT